MTRPFAPRTMRSALAIATLSFLIPACSPSSGAAASDTMTADTSSWRSLMGPDLAQLWRGYRADSIPGAWHMVGDTLTKSRGTDDIITREPYSDFELELDWKLSPGGNAGVFYRATEEYDHIYWSGPPQWPIACATALEQRATTAWKERISRGRDSCARRARG